MILSLVEATESDMMAQVDAALSHDQLTQMELPMVLLFLVSAAEQVSNVDQFTLRRGWYVPQLSSVLGHP